MGQANQAIEARLPSRGEVADFLYPIVRRLCREQGFTFVPKGKSKHPSLIAPTGERTPLPTTLFDGPVRHVYLAKLRRIGADLTFPDQPPETVTPTGDAPGMGAAVDMPWTDSEWRSRQAEAAEWWRHQYHRAPEPAEVATLAAQPVERWSAYGRDLMARLDASQLPRSDARSDTYMLADARQMVRDGYSVEQVSRRTGWGTWWLADAV